MRWETAREVGSAAELHRRSAELVASPRAVRSLRLLEVASPALVLGSAQPFSHVDPSAARAAGIEVVRRRSGGGAVYVSQSTLVWVDVVVPHGDSLWHPDVGVAAWWLGEAWARALSEAGVGGARVWQSAMRRTAWSDRVCFAGTGPGEVLLGGSKVVGISQRRTRSAALFQTALVVDWDPGRLLDVLALDDAERQTASHELADAATGVGAPAAAAALEALASCLPA
ncbi:MAG TPA: hypothetical protein VFH56_07360 [Acidimicrobiales bacterium]|nr:hypothetical protein [Acidimicrobiales bacterium]